MTIKAVYPEHLPLAIEVQRRQIVRQDRPHLRVEFEDARPYHPNMDSIVRSEARRLRSKLKEYYESTGKDDPVFIYYRLGSYVPVFRLHRSEGQGTRTAVLPFVDASRGDLSGACAQIITDELIHEIGRTEGFRVSTASSSAPLVAQALDLPAVARKLDVSERL